MSQNIVYSNNPVGILTIGLYFTDKEPEFTNYYTSSDLSVGIITASAFYGDGSGLTGIVGTGSGIEIQENGSPVGTAATINFRSNIDVSFAGGVATIDATGGGGGGESYWTKTVTGIHTLSNVGIGTTNPTSKLTITGDANITGVVTASAFYGDGSGLTGIVGTGGTSGIQIKDDSSVIGNVSIINFGSNLDVSPISAGIVTVTVSGIGSITNISSLASLPLV